METPSIYRIDESVGSARKLVLVKGFLTHDDTTAEDHRNWSEGLREAGWRGEIWVYRWDSSCAGKLFEDVVLTAAVGGGAGFAASRAVSFAAKRLLPRLALRAGLVSVAGPPLWAWTAFDVGATIVGVTKGSWYGVRKHWGVIRDRSERIGRERLLSDIKNAGIEEVTLVGHSLGARMIDSALQFDRASGVTIEDVIYFGAALGEKDDQVWEDVAGAVKGKIVNVYNTKDKALRDWYQRLEKEVALGMREMKAAINRCADEFFGDEDDSHSHYWKHIRSTISRDLWST